MISLTDSGLLLVPLLSKADMDSVHDCQRIVDAVEKTLNYFGISEDRETCAENLCRLRALRNLNQKVEWDEEDERVRALVKMLEHLDSLLDDDATK